MRFSTTSGQNDHDCISTTHIVVGVSCWTLGCLYLLHNAAARNQRRVDLFLVVMPYVAFAVSGTDSQARETYEGPSIHSKVRSTNSRCMR